MPEISPMASKNEPDKTLVNEILLHVDDAVDYTIDLSSVRLTR